MKCTILIMIFFLISFSCFAENGLRGLKPFEGTYIPLSENPVFCSSVSKIKFTIDLPYRDLTTTFLLSDGEVYDSYMEVFGYLSDFFLEHMEYLDRTVFMDSTLKRVGGYRQFGQRRWKTEKIFLKVINANEIMYYFDNTNPSTPCHMRKT